MRGQIGLITAIVGATGMILASAFTGWFSASSGIDEVRAEVSNVRNEANLIKTTEELHYKELKEDIGEIKRDVKSILNALSK